MGANFCRLDIVVQDRPIYDAMGNRVTGQLPMVSGQHLIHWADPDRAMAWFRVADALLRNTALLGPLGAAVNVHDRTANNAMAGAQFTYVLRVLDAIAKGYNLLNVVWWNDPPARSIYRQWIAGPPEAAGQNSSYAVFGQSDNYNDAWYVPNVALPHATSGRSILQSVALRQTKQNDGALFVPSAMLLLTSVNPVARGQTVESADAVHNAAFVRMMSRVTCPANVAETDAYLCTFDPRSASLPIVYGYMPDRTILPWGFDDWRAAYSGSLTWDKGGITAPLVEYLGYLRAWVGVLLARSAYQIIQDARAFAVYENARSFSVNGGLQSAIQSMMDTDPAIYAQVHAQDPGLNLAANAAVALGAAASLVPGTMGIPALIGGAVGLVTKLASMGITGNVSGHGRDDLGRYKLRFERGWLSGDPASIDVSEGAPLLTQADRTDPPGYPVTPPACPVGPLQAPPSDITPTGAPVGSDGGKIAVGLAFALGLGYLGYRQGWFGPRRKR